MDKEEFLRRYKDGERDFSGIELKNADLRGIYLADVIFRRAKLISVNLSSSELWRADLSEADLSNSNLSYADLEAVNLRNAILTNTDLSYTDLIGADLTGTNIEGALNLNLASHYTFLVDESKNKNIELLAKLRELTRGFHHRYNSESSSYYDIFLWDTATRGNFTVLKIFRSSRFSCRS